MLEAREHQALGRRLLEAGNYNAALAEFERVYGLLEGHPRRFTALANIGRCHQSLGRYDLAVESYRRYLAEAPADVPERAQVETTLNTLDELLGTLDVTLNGPARAEVWLGDRRAGTAPGAVRVPGGRHSIEVRAPGYLPARVEVSVSARARVPVAFTMERPRRGLARGYFFAGAGLTAGVAVAGAVFGGLALSERGALQARIDRGEQVLLRENAPEGATRDDAAITRNATIADVLFVSAGALAVGTVVLAAVTDWRGASSEARAPTASVFIDPRGGLAVGGRF